jgi:hypothetical protein
MLLLAAWVLLLPLAGQHCLRLASTAYSGDYAA